mmetsp:Transcript_6990/g.18794  ORF Transcript_6990/g.18794 Transcript_6990/m.18794 type:complete len:271 (-) Transcript_6990:49-861(-)
MVIKRLGQTVLRHLLQNGRKRGKQILVQAGVNLDCVVKCTQGSVHDAGVLVAQCCAEVLVYLHARKGTLVLWVKLVEVMEHHDSFLAHMLFGVAKPVHHHGVNSVDKIRPYELCGHHQGGTHIDEVVALQVTEQRVHKQKHKLMVVIQELGQGQVGCLLGKQVGLACKLQGLHVGKTGVMAQHLAINEPDHVLLPPAFVELGIREPLFQHLQLPGDDAILLQFALAFSNCLDETLKLTQVAQELGVGDALHKLVAKFIHHLCRSCSARYC